MGDEVDQGSSGAGGTERKNGRAGQVFGATVLAGLGLIAAGYSYWTSHMCTGYGTGATLMVVGALVLLVAVTVLLPRVLVSGGSTPAEVGRTVGCLSVLLLAAVVIVGFFTTMAMAFGTDSC